MSSNVQYKSASDLALQLIDVLGLPQRIQKFSLHFQAAGLIVADVTYYPEIGSPLVTETRFACVPVDLTESAAAGV